MNIIYSREEFIELRKEVIRKDFAKLNDMQFSAITAVNGPLLVLAGAGSGKTTVLVNRIENMIKYGDAYLSNECYVPLCQELFAEGNAFINGDIDEVGEGFSLNAVKPWQILAITFTNKAANELKNRIIYKIGEAGNEVCAGTFHSVCAKWLRIDGHRIGYSSHFTIYDTDDQKRLIKEIYKDLGFEEKMLPIKACLSEISRAKEALIDCEEYQSNVGYDEFRKKVAKVYSLYSKKLQNADAMDFDDLIVNVVRLFEASPETLEKYQNRYKYIMVDEYQDTNHAQYVFISKLAEKRRNICVVGDDDQSIYRFRGATIKNILEFEDEYENAKVIRLEQNYRSTSVILDAANAVIRNNTERKGKNLWSQKQGGEKIKIHTSQNEQFEAKYVVDKIEENVSSGDKFSDNAVLYRINALSRSVENVLVRSGIPYKVIGGHKFYERKEIKDVLAYLQLINNTNDNLRLSRIINEPKRGIGDTSLKNALQIATDLSISAYEVISNAEDYPLISRAAAKFSQFCEIIEQLRAYSEVNSVYELCREVVNATGYASSLREQGEEGKERLQNIDELLNGIKQYEEENEAPSLSGFLEEVSLISDIDKYDQSSDAVVLMTVHSAKGLEFTNVYLIGMEEGIFPGTQSIFEGPEEIEEERRLAYVAITRAKEKLYITNSYERTTFGSTGRNLSSRFVKEIPGEHCEITSNVSSPFKFGSDSSFGGYSYQSTQSFSKNKPIQTATYSRPAVNAAPKTNYRVGDRVNHKVFGNGTIASQTPMGNDTLLQINFDSGESKKIMANFARLEKI